MTIRKTIAALVAAGVLSVGACSTATDTTTTSTATTSATSSSTPGSSAATARGGGSAPGPDASAVNVGSVTTEAELIALVQEAYGDASLDLHRGHQPVQDVLDEVLTISHDELHVRMNQGQNLAAVATDLGIDPQTLVAALVESWSPAVDSALAAGAITEQEAAAYRAALAEAFTFRVTWDGAAQTPTFSGVTV